MKVLLSAYACQPDQGSEPGIGWNWVVQASQEHDVWVLTREENRKRIEAKLQDSPIPGVNFVYHELPVWLRVLSIIGQRLGLGLYIHMFLWQVTAVAPAKKLQSEIAFDVAHHVTYGSVRNGSFLKELDIPFIWGAVGGMEEAPRGLLHGLPRRYRLLEAIRASSNNILVLMPGVRKTARTASRVLATTQETADKLSQRLGIDIDVVPNIGITPPSSPPERYSPPGGRVQLLYVGRLVYWKGIDLAIESIAGIESEHSGLSLNIIGAGPDKTRLANLVNDLGLGDSVHFLGALPPEEVRKHLEDSDIFVFPSLHDSGGFAVLEAMAAGLPVICMDLGGPGLAVTDSCGIKIRAADRRSAVTQITGAIKHLSQNEELRRSLGRSGYQRVCDAYEWDGKRAIISRLYCDLVSARS